MQTLILRIGAIVILLSLLEKVPISIEAIINNWQNNPDVFAVLFSMAPGIFALVISFLLWFYPSTLSSQFSAKNENSSLDNDKSGLFGDTLISVIGLYILAHAIPDLIYHIVLIIVSSKENIVILPIDRAASVATIAEIVIGMFLLYRSSLVHKFIQGLKREMKEKSL
jgi:hypothetical protein